jgi:hypothetical protein
MKKNIFLPLILIILLVGCKKSSNVNQDTKTLHIEDHSFLNVKQETSINLDSICQLNFRNFIEDLKKESSKDLKKYFKFPMSNQVIWDVIKFNNEIDTLVVNQSFSENDFEIYFKNIFSEKFIKLLNELDTEELFKLKEFKTKSIFEDESSINSETYLYAYLVEKKKELYVSYIIKNSEDGDIYEVSIIYLLEFNELCQLININFMIAG